MYRCEARNGNLKWIAGCRFSPAVEFVSTVVGCNSTADKPNYPVRFEQFNINLNFAKKAQ